MAIKYDCDICGQPVEIDDDHTGAGFNIPLNGAELATDYEGELVHMMACDVCFKAMMKRAHIRVANATN